MINYQGRIAVGGTNFNGTGQFEFSLVNSNGTVTFWSNDGTGSGGGQPTTPVSLNVTKGLYSVQLGDTTLANMTAVPAALFTNTDVRLRVWFNDGVNGFQLLSPDERIAAVGYAMMAATVPDGSITTSKLAAGAITANQLAPGAALTNLQASGQAGVASGGIVLSTSANATNLLNAGYVRVPSLRVDGAVEKWETVSRYPYPNPYSPGPVSANTALWDGTEMIVWGGSSSTGDTTTDVNVGGRYYPATDSWLPTSTNVPPGSSQTAVWSGSDMILWGGTLGIQGWRYNPVSDSWTAMSTNVAPPARSGHIAYYVTNNNTMVIWFGTSLGGGTNTFLNDGWRYSNNTWTAIGSVANTPSARTSPLSCWDGYRIIVYSGLGLDTNNNPLILTNGARITGTNLSAGWTVMGGTFFPPGRLGGTAVTTGTNLTIWGGYTTDFQTFTNYLNSGARYFPGANPAWVNIAASPLAARQNHAAVSTGTKMLIFGGDNGSNYFGDGAVYDSLADSWSSMTTNSEPAARTSPSAVWDGAEMIVWGGFDGTNVINTGGRYNPTLNVWSNVLATISPVGRALHTAVWTGSEMLVWGGFEGEYYFNSGGEYTPATDTWLPITTTNAPAGRANHTAVWTGSQMVVWGGNNAYSNFNNGGRFDPVAGVWTPTSTANAPTPRTDHTAIWDGTEMIVWGGNNAGTNLNTGGRYIPTSDTWTAVTTASAPGPRENHTAIWDGTDMIVWGGDNSTNAAYLNPLSDGARYTPTSGIWTALPSLNAPSPRTTHAAVWDGTEMIVWSGNDGTNFLQTGGKFNPTSNTWVATETSGAPIGNPDPNVVWDGNEMLVWAESSGGRYDPVSDSWRAINPPSTFSYPVEGTAVWTGTEMLLFGGFDGDDYLNANYSYTPPQTMYIYQKP